MKPLIGIFGGTFDPVHKGHLAVAEHLLASNCFSTIHMIPCQLPVHKASPLFSSEQRLQLLRLCLEKQSQQLIADDREITRNSASYSDETIAEFKQNFPEQPLALIMGYDAWEHFDQWRNWQQILQQSHLIILSRPGYQLATPAALASHLKTHQVERLEQLQQAPAGKIFVCKEIAAHHSSTQIRQLLQKQQWQKLEKHLAPEILSWIKHYKQN